jgi:cytochrome P450
MLFVFLELMFRLPYTEAVLLEIQRVSSIAPLLPPHLTLTDVTYRDYKIPKVRFHMHLLAGISNFINV